MSDVPSELHREILLRLPTESLFRFRAVCKSWLRIIDDPSFVRSHNHRSSPNLILFTTATNGTLFSFPLDSLNYINGKQTVHARSLVHQGVPWTPMPRATCNGLLLISSHVPSKIWAIWNPLNDSLQYLPQFDYEEDKRLIGSGICYDSNSDDYKVVRIDKISGRTAHRTLIYSLKSNSWKRAKDCPHDITHTEALFFKGSLHWPSFSTIVALDMATEEYRLLPMPPIKYVGLPFTLGGCLVMTSAREMESAWVMRGYGGEDPFWEEMFSSEERWSLIGGVPGDLVFPVAYNDTQRRLILQNGNKIIRWDIEKRAVKRVTIDGPQINCRDLINSQVVPGSLFRLNCDPIGAATGTRSAKRKRSKATIKRLKFTATTIDS